MTNEPHKFVAEIGDERSRLDRFVVGRFERVGETVSRSTVQRWIHAGQVTLDGKPSEPSARIPIGTEIVVTPIVAVLKVIYVHLRQKYE